MVFRRGKQLVISDLPGLEEATLIRPGIFVRGFDKIDRKKYRLPILSYATDSNYARKAVRDPWIKAICLTEELAGEIGYQKFENKALILHQDPASLFYWMHNTLATSTDLYWGQHSAPVIGQGSKISASAYIEPNVKIGSNVTVGPGAMIMSGTVVGSDSVIIGGAVIGEESIEMKFIKGIRTQIRHVGGVRIGRGAVIAPRVIVSRSLFHGTTSLGDFTSVGESSHVGHGTSVGDSTTISGGVMIGGSCAIGANVFLGMGSIVRDSVTVGDDAHISMAAAVVADVEPGQRVTGVYAKDSRLWAAEQRQVRTARSRGPFSANHAK